MVNKGNAKRKGIWKGKRKMGSKLNANLKPDPTKALKPKGGVPKVGDYHYCKKPGHWKRNCHAYLEDLKKKKVAASDSDDAEPSNADEGAAQLYISVTFSLHEAQRGGQ
ncbi:hypothetical protein AgCh_007503 [Apium graveolens]